MTYFTPLKQVHVKERIFSVFPDVVGRNISSIRVTESPFLMLTKVEYPDDYNNMIEGTRILPYVLVDGGLLCSEEFDTFAGFFLTPLEDFEFNRVNVIRQLLDVCHSFNPESVKIQFQPFQGQSMLR